MASAVGWIVVAVVLVAGLWYLKKHTHVLDKFFPGSTPVQGGDKAYEDMNKLLTDVEAEAKKHCPPCAVNPNSQECLKCIQGAV